ncbi:MAG TPA: hypothetical protein VGO71_09055 [Baekduia sp.]|jgi:hypothetical protein|nr:hypothetical protein [Baekduia sp.]
MNRLATLTAVLLSTLALPTAALAAGDDPLLSGYGGPGSGDQAVLGGGTIGGGGKGGGSGSSGGGAGGSLRAATPSVPATPAPATPASPTTSSASSGGSSSAKHTKSARHHRAHPSTPAAATHTSSTATSGAGTSTNLPQRATTSIRVDRSSAGTFPLSTGDLLLALVVALAIAALAVATSRLSRGAAQASDARG